MGLGATLPIPLSVIGRSNPLAASSAVDRIVAEISELPIVAFDRDSTA
jgi:hypothetical protein